MIAINGVASLNWNGLSSINWNGVGGAPAYYVQDTFTEASTVELTSHTPDYDHVGGGWIKQTGTNPPDVTSSGYVTGGTTDTTFMYIDAGASDVKVTTKMWFSSIFQTMYLVARVVDGSNYWRMLRSPAAHTCQLQEVNAGSITTRGDTYTSGTGSANVWSRFTCWLNGDAMTWSYYIDEAGSPTRTYNYTSSLHNTATKHGFIMTNSAQRWDDFEITPYP